MPEFVSQPQRWVVPAVLLLAIVGGVVAVWWERRRPSSFTRPRTDDLAWWGRLSADEQEAHDLAVLDVEEADRIAAARMQEAAKRNALFHPRP